MVESCRLSTDTCGECQEAVQTLLPSCRSCGIVLEWPLELPCPECETVVEYRAGDCPCCETSLGAWRAIRQLALEAEEDLVIAKDGIDHPTGAGFRTHIGSFKGQRRDYRYPLGDGSDIHVREFGDRYAVHHDAVSAVDHPVGHVVAHAPHYLVGAAGMAAMALARSQRSRSALETAVGPLRAQVGRNLTAVGLPSLGNLVLSRLLPFR